MTYLFTDPQPITGNIGVLTSGAIVTNANPFPVTLGTSANISVAGNINVPGNVEVYSSPENPVHVHLSEVGNYGLLDQFVPVEGTVYLGANTLANLSHINANITNSSISVKQSGDWTVGISNVNVNVSQYGLWNVGILGVPTVDVRSMPANASVLVTGNVNISAMPTVTLTSNAVNATVSGTVTLTSNAVNATVSGTVNAVQSGVWYANINNFPVSTQVTNLGTFAVQATQSGTWYANVNNFPTTQNITGNVYVLNGNNAGANVVYGDTTQLDSTDRLRVSLLGQQWYYVPTVDKDGDLRINEAFQGAGASSTFIQNLASVRLTSGQYYDSNASLTGSAIRASRRRHKSRPGVAQEWVGVVNWDGLQTNVSKRVGLFTNFNGLFFEANATTINTVIRRRLTDGTIVETRTPYTSWNMDKMDGTGASGYNWNAAPVTANVTSVSSQANVAISGDGNVYTVTYQLTAGEESKLTVGKKVTATGITPSGFNDTGLVTSINSGSHQATVAFIAYPGTYVSTAAGANLTSTPFHNEHTYWFDFNGSRTGRVRFGLYTDAGKVVVHEYKGGEIGSQWSSAPAFMDRKEIVNTGQPVDFLPSLTIGGSAVGIETTAEINPGFGVALASTPVAYSKSLNEEYAILGVGLRYGEPYQRADLKIDSIQLTDISNINSQRFPVYQYRLVLDPTLSGTIPGPTNTGKATQMWDYATGVTVSGGITLFGGYMIGTGVSQFQTALNFLNMGSSIDNTTADKVVLVVKLLNAGSADGSIIGAINFTEDL